MQDIYYITGSPCCGKSSIAERLSARHGLAYYKLDDFLDPYMQTLAEEGDALCKAVCAYSMEEMWMRDPALLCEEERTIYRAMAPLIRQAFEKMPAGLPILAEGAGFLPDMLRQEGVSPARVAYLVPSKAFQLEKYAERPWITHYLQGCSDPKQAFSNWMERDALFAEAMAEDARACGYSVTVVDGSKDIDTHAAQIERHFGLA